jgi:hypothetical protein
MQKDLILVEILIILNPPSCPKCTYHAASILLTQVSFIKKINCDVIRDFLFFSIYRLGNTFVAGVLFTLKNLYIVTKWHFIAKNYCIYIIYDSFCLIVTIFLLINNFLFYKYSVKVTNRQLHFFLIT